MVIHIIQSYNTYNVMRYFVRYTLHHIIYNHRLQGGLALALVGVALLASICRAALAAIVCLAAIAIKAQLV